MGESDQFHVIQRLLVRAHPSETIKQGRRRSTIFFISCARACTVACEVSTEAQFFADCKLHILTRSMSFGRRQFLEKKNYHLCDFLDLS